MTDTHFTPDRKKQLRPRGYIEDYRPQKATEALLLAVEAVLEEYRNHWPLTCRQIFYRLVGAYDYPKDEPAYKRLCHHLSNARRGRRIPFDAIRDDGVTTFHLQHFEDEDHFRRHLRELAEGYTRNRLVGQEIHCEVWCEAGGMVPQLYGVAAEFSVRVYSCGGFDSLTIKKNLSDRICEIGKPTVILHLGDYDPSGVNMFKAVAEDVAAFVETDKPWNPVDVTYVRVALTREQVERYALPTAPPKSSDPGTKTWTGGGTCQLEALPPDTVIELLFEALEDHLSVAHCRQVEQEEEIERRRLVRSLPKPRQ
jgi:hypothetical protein